MADAAASPSTLSELLASTVAEHGDRPAIIDSRRTLTWRDIGAMVEGYAAELCRLGAGRGDRIALWLPNSADYLALIFAVARIGAISVHVNTRFRAHEAGSLLRRTEPAILIGDFTGAADLAEVFNELPEPDKSSLRRILGIGGTPPGRVAAAVEPLRAAGKIADAGRPDDPCAIFTTTGSTGEPKLVVHGQRGLAVHHRFAARACGFDRPDAMILANLPFCGVFGHTRLLMAVAGGAGVVLQDSADISELVRRRRVTDIAGFADTLARFVEAADGRPYDSMRAFGVAPSPFVDNDAVYAEARALGLTLRSSYGSTEACVYIAVPPESWGPVSGGVLTHPDARFVISDPDTGRDLPEGEPGALLIAGPSMFLRYHNDPAATAAAWTVDGLFRTGDRAYRRGDGFVLLGRYDETIRLGGFLVDPAEIETFLRLRPEVARARVVGADLGQGPRAVAFVVARKGCVVDEAAILEACREQIASFKVPARIIVLDEFPVADGANATKIRLDVLRDMAAALRSDQRRDVGVRDPRAG
jgi:fatty-acyl-CoA synthase